MIRCIIVDDEPLASVVIKYLIESRNIPMEIVGESSDGKQALKLIDELSPDIVFLDIQMPNMNGFEVMQEKPELNYVIITAYESFENAQKALRLGAKDILLKPIDYDGLMKSIQRAVNWAPTKNYLTNQIIDYIQKHYSEKIELNQLAKDLFTTSSHIARTFKKNTGTSVINYLHDVRIKKASEMLIETDLDVKEISVRVGYNSLNNFYKYFKLLEGMTPVEYKNMHRKDGYEI